MSWTLVYFLFVVLLFAIFSMVNLKNTCNISFLFYEFKDIPVYTAAMFSFITGTFLSLPFFIRHRRKNKEKNPIVGNINTVELKNDKGSSFFSWFKRRKNNDSTDKMQN